LVSGAFGAVVGEVTLGFFPDSGLSIGAFALVAMAATFGAATRATLTSIVFVFELTRDFDAILPLILASVLADLVGAWLLPNSLMTEKLHRRGYRVQTDLQADVMASTLVEDVMTREVVTVAVDTDPAEAAEVVDATGHTVLPVMSEEGDLYGIISRSDLLADDALVARSVGDFCRTDVVTIDRRATVGDASRLMIAEGVDHIPVVDEEGRLVGMFTRTDILKAASTALAAESPEEGWLSRYRRHSR